MINYKEVRSPHHDFLIVKRFKKPEKTSGGILLPEDYLQGQDHINTEYRWVEIVHVTEYIKQREPDLQVGKKVFVHELNKISLNMKSEDGFDIICT